VSNFLSRLMGAFVGQGKVSSTVAARRLVTCRTNQCGKFTSSEHCGVCKCHMPSKVVYASVKLPGKDSETVRCPKGLW
jgi:hypothetical protein